MSWITFLVDWLNRYANLLLTIITAVYAYLTWKALKALERSGNSGTVLSSQGSNKNRPLADAGWG
jgi:hypothetical protein